MLAGRGLKALPEIGEIGPQRGKRIAFRRDGGTINAHMGFLFWPTGGLAPLFNQTDGLFDAWDEHLTMHGLRLIHDYNREMGNV